MKKEQKGGKMESLWEKVKQGFLLAAERTDELTKIGKLKFSIVGLHRTIKQNFEELGGKVYELAKSSRRKKPVTDDEEVRKLIKKIKRLEKQLSEEEKNLKNLLNKT
jgi:predicted RNase H-like nuclease (RuvC/YqgF family)